MGRRPTLRDYEILYIVRPELEESQVDDAVNQVNKLIENLGGTPQRTDVWGKRRLAYEVNRLREGYYVLTDFQIDQPRIPEMEATLRISETVFRHVIVRKPPKNVSTGRQAAPAAAAGGGAAADGQPARTSPQAGAGAGAAAAEPVRTPVTTPPAPGTEVPVQVAPVAEQTEVARVADATDGEVAAVAEPAGEIMAPPVETTTAPEEEEK